MREIKFRAWDKLEREMICEALEIKNIGLGEGSVLIDKGTQRGNELTWLQYTGLKDKNGKEIYEGDIDSKGRVVEYKIDMSGYYLMKNWGGFHLCHSQNVLNGCIKHVEIIGNIYENPELLTGVA